VLNCLGEVFVQNKREKELGRILSEFGSVVFDTPFIREPISPTFHDQLLLTFSTYKLTMVKLPNIQSKF
jgi:hypothetical protein